MFLKGKRFILFEKKFDAPKNLYTPWYNDK